ncbi:MAG: asparagine synthetase [Candidatus Thorarchaeota archaeon]|nr:MAG: asparagine synthetase [Candidatus Thorarchaeota archaeon]
MTMTTEPLMKTTTHPQNGNGSYSQIFRVQTEALRAMHDFLSGRGLIQLMPVILSPITDPLNHSVDDAYITYNGQKLQLTKSMILHKQIAVSALDTRGIYIVSPNVRLERVQSSDRHLLEFSQLDIELKTATASEFMTLIEDLMIYIISQVKATCADELEKLNATLRIPRRPFRTHTSWSLLEEYGPHYESEISRSEDDLFWITDFQREFYDREDPEHHGHYVNYDLVYPEGYQEALSGGERDYEYYVLVRKIRERGQKLDDFAPYLELARAGMLGPSAGGGLGIERLIRFLTKRSNICEITLFPRIPNSIIKI